jgi:L-lactate dehydrogenase
MLFQLIMTGTFHEVLLIGRDGVRAAAEAEVIDISHATPCAYDNRIRSGDGNELSGSEIVIFTCGISQKPRQTRLDLLKINAQICKEIIPQAMQ